MVTIDVKDAQPPPGYSESVQAPSTAGPAPREPTQSLNVDFYVDNTGCVVSYDPAVNIDRESSRRADDVYLTSPQRA